MPHGREGRLDRICRTEMNPMLRRVIIERQQFVNVIGDLRYCLGDLVPYKASNRPTASRACRRSSAFQISTRAFFAVECADFGSAARTFAILWNQHRCARV